MRTKNKFCIWYCLITTITTLTLTRWIVRGRLVNPPDLFGGIADGYIAFFTILCQPLFGRRESIYDHAHGSFYDLGFCAGFILFVCTIFVVIHLHRKSSIKSDSNSDNDGNDGGGGFFNEFKPKPPCFRKTITKYDRIHLKFK